MYKRFSKSVLRIYTPFVLFVVIFCVFTGCNPAPRTSYSAPEGTPPTMLIGTFVDDYDLKYEITRERWFQKPRSIYHIIKWDAEAQFLIAQNDQRNSENGNLWTRIDWLVLSDSAPYEWAFCLSAYDSPTASEAELVQIAKRDSPRTGCNGFPFSRMRPN